MGRSPDIFFYHESAASDKGRTSLAIVLLLLGSSLGVFSQAPVQVENGEGSGETEAEPDTYWSGSAPLCLGGCRGKHRELKRDRCGDSSCCWIGSKSLCRVNCGKPDSDFNGVVFESDWWVGSVVRQSCRPDFMLVGDPVRTCQSDGKWTPRSSCVRVCFRGRLEINEKDIDGTCTSACPTKTYVGSPHHGCSRIDNCQTKRSGWKRWFMGCDYCECDCSVPCATSA